MHSFIKIRKRRCFKKSCSCLGAISLFNQCMQSAMGCPPLKQTVLLYCQGASPERQEGDGSGDHPQSALTGDKAASTSAKGSTRTLPEEVVRGHSESVHFLWRHLPRAPALTCSAHLAMLHLHATALFPGAELLPWKPSSDSRGA